MPYKRIGKTVYKKLPNGKLESVGTSDSIEKAKAHLRALYASETNEPLTEGLSPEVSNKAKAIFKSMIADKRDVLFKRYGAEAEKVAYGRAIAKAKQEMENKTTQNEEKLREMVRAALKEPPPNNKIYYSDETAPTADDQLDGYIIQNTGLDNEPEKWSVYKNLKTGKYNALHRTIREPKRPTKFQSDETQPEPDERLHGYISRELPDGEYEKWAIYYDPTTNSLTSRHRAQDIDERMALSEDDWQQPDDESSMAKTQLQSIIRDAQNLEYMIQDNEQLDAWVQSKITKAQDYLASVYNYMNGEAEQDKQTMSSPLAERIFNRIKNRM